MGLYNKNGGYNMLFEFGVYRAGLDFPASFLIVGKLVSWV